MRCESSTDLNLRANPQKTAATKAGPKEISLDSTKDTASQTSVSKTGSNDRTKPTGLDVNWSILSQDEQALAEILLKAGQAHLFDEWDAPGTNDELKHAFFAHVERLHRTYPFPGGLLAYIERARRLLAGSAAGANSLDDWVPTVPEGEVLKPGSEEFSNWEAVGEAELSATAFVLVAGGLGERLGYSGIKVALPTEMTTETSYLEFYCNYLVALGMMKGKGKVPPLAIMVSDDTHDRTLAVLQANDFFGFPRDQLTLMKQEKVPALMDNNARIARPSRGTKGVDDVRYAIDCKPHGHGDVHSLLHSTGLARRWEEDGLKWVVFFQDTNALAFFSLAAALAVSARRDLAVNSLAIPRVPKQAIGAITRLTRTSGTETQVMIVNVEYNQLDPLLRAAGSGEGDTADPATGHSPYPGNINQLIFALTPYVATLEKTHGVMAEFVNPKYADGARTVFKKPTRLECMMQDFPKVLGPEAKVGFTSLPAWFSFSPVKNNIADAAKALESGTPPGGAATGEADQYFAYAEQLRLLGCRVMQAPTESYAGVSVSLGPRVVIAPSIALTYHDLRAIFVHPEKVSIDAAATLVIRGPGKVEVDSITLEGALILSVGQGTTVVLKDLTLKNKGHLVRPLTGKEESDEVSRMRGYRLVKMEELRVQAPPNAGRLFLTAQGTLTHEKDLSAKGSAATQSYAATTAATPAAALTEARDGQKDPASQDPSHAADATQGSGEGNEAKEAPSGSQTFFSRIFSCFRK